MTNNMKEIIKTLKNIFFAVLAILAIFAAAIFVLRFISKSYEDESLRGDSNKNNSPNPKKRKVSIGKVNKKVLGDLGGLNARQKRILAFIENKKVADPSQLYSLFPSVSKRTIRRDCDKLQLVGKIVQTGKTKNTIYKIKN